MSISQPPQPTQLGAGGNTPQTDSQSSGKTNGRLIAPSYRSCIACFADLDAALYKQRKAESKRSSKSPGTQQGSLSKKEMYRNLNALFKSFKLWGVDCGMHWTGRSSIDYRLKDASHIYRELVNMLQELEDALDEGM